MSPKIIFLTALLGLGHSAFAWDGHRILTRAALNRPNTVLSSKVPITSFDSFLSTTFPGCSKMSFFNDVWEGVGERYEMGFVDHTESQLFVSDDLLSINTLLKFFPVAPALGTGPFPGAEAAPADVLAVYSDEPDWNLDIDVPRLKDHGPAQNLRGTATQVLRHFWFGSREARNRGIETLSHAQRAFEIALASFGAGQDYWGYRFLSHAIHYLQDLTQPFHTQLIPSWTMVRRFEFVSAGLCDFVKRQRLEHPGRYLNRFTGERCDAKSPTKEQATYFSGLSVIAYHTIYESYARESLRVALQNNDMGFFDRDRSETFQFQVHRDRVESLNREPLDFSHTDNGVAELGTFLDTVAGRTRQMVGHLAHEELRAFGMDYKDKSGIKRALQNIFTEQNPGYRLARGLESLSFSQAQAEQRLRALTADLISWSTELTRQMIAEAMQTPVASKRRTLGELRGMCK